MHAATKAKTKSVASDIKSTKSCKLNKHANEAVKAKRDKL